MGANSLRSSSSTTPKSSSFPGFRLVDGFKEVHSECCHYSKGTEFDEVQEEAKGGRMRCLKLWVLRAHFREGEGEREREEILLFWSSFLYFIRQLSVNQKFVMSQFVKTRQPLT